MTDPTPTHKLHIMPLPEGGETSPTEALRWLREDYGPYQVVANSVAAEGRTKDEREAACILGLDVHVMVEGCAEAIDSGKPVSFGRWYADWTNSVHKAEFDGHTLDLTRVVASAPVLDHSEGPFEWAYEELTQELAKRIVYQPPSASE